MQSDRASALRDVALLLQKENVCNLMRTAIPQPNQQHNMKSFNELLDRFFSSSKCNTPTARCTEVNQKGFLRDQVYDSEDTGLGNLTGRDNDNFIAQNNSQSRYDMPKNNQRVGLRSPHERSCRQEIMVIINQNGQEMSHTNLQSLELPEIITDYGNRRSSRRYLNERHKLLENRKRRISEDLESFITTRGKRRKLFERSPTPVGQSGNSRYQALATPQLNLSTNLPQKSQSYENIRSSHRETIIPNSPVGVGVNQTSRTRQTRISSEGQILKPPRQSEISHEKLASILEKHVFSHIRKAIKIFHEELSDKDRTEIGTDALQVIIEHPDFKKHLKANQNSILPEYEAALATQASSYINRRARKALGDEIVNRLLHCPITDHVSPNRFSYNDVRSRSSSCSSLSSCEPEEIFCRQEELHTRSNSFSPSTSLGTDQTDIETVKKSSISPSHEHLSSKRPVRSTKASNPRYTKPSTRGSVKPQRHIPTPVCKESDRPMEIIIVPRPYLSLHTRKTLLGELGGKVSQVDSNTSTAFPHVPFTDAEISHIVSRIKRLMRRTAPSHTYGLKFMTDLMSGRIQLVTKIVDSISFEVNKFCTSKLLYGRTYSDIVEFLIDTVNNTVSDFATIKPINPSISDSCTTQSKLNPINRLLRHREIDGLCPARLRRGLTSYREVVSSFLEDSLAPQSQWSDCSNDIAAITWTSDDAFIVGALAHSDPHNMQYNKPGNLLVGSVSQNTLRSYPHHKIERPIVSKHQNLENSLDSMRATQSPWLYTSVVSSAHSSVSGYSFTSSYDNTVKVWKVLENGSEMILHGTWVHEAIVNFVVTSEHHDRVATASDTNRNAVRVYHFCKNAINKSPYDEYGGNKSQEQSGDLDTPRPWAYLPATIKWARPACISNLLLVGYSPRADSGDDSDIPDDKKNTGELCVWDTEDGARFHVSSARMQNVFDAVWHPTQPVFAAATSPFGNYDSERTKTQVRIFALNDNTFTSIMTLDCPALDITELTLMPNSAIKAYVTASCTDGCTYVWDVAQGEDPIHILRHGESIDNPEPDLPLELADGGVTFSAWGADVSRFYTGATDGKLIAWDIRKSPGNAFVRNVLELSGGISCGAFIKDFKKLLIGDSTGKVHLLSIDDSDLSDDESSAIDISKTTGGSCDPGFLRSNIRQPRFVIPHPEPAPPRNIRIEESESSYQDSSHTFLEKGILQLYPGKGVFQGPRYHESGLFRLEAHERGDAQRPLKHEIMAEQQFLQNEVASSLHITRLPRPRKYRLIADHKAHQINVKLDFDFSSLTTQTKGELERDRVELDWDFDQAFDYELAPQSPIFHLNQKENHRSSRGDLLMDDIDELALGA